MCHEDSEVYEGVLSEYDIDSNFAIVIVSTSLNVHVGLFKHTVEILPHGMVLALGRAISGKLVPTNVILSNEAPLWQMSEVNLSYDTNIPICFYFDMHQTACQRKKILSPCNPWSFHLIRCANLYSC